MTTELATTEVLEPGELSLRELGERASTEHEQAWANVAEGLQHAIQSGEFLLRAREQVGRSAWGQWLAENFRGSATQANKYMRLAHYKDHVVCAQVPSLEAAVRYLKGRPDINKRGYEGAPESVRKEAQRLRDEGLTLQAIADLLGVSNSTVCHWVVPESYKKQKERHAKYMARRRAERKALRKQERERAIKQAARNLGKPAEEAWLTMERFQDVLAAFERSLPDGPAKHKHITAAWLAYHNLRDDIVKAMGIT